MWDFFPFPFIIIIIIIKPSVLSARLFLRKKINRDEGNCGNIISRCSRRSWPFILSEPARIPVILLLIDIRFFSIECPFPA